MLGHANLRILAFLSTVVMTSEASAFRAEPSLEYLLRRSNSVVRVRVDKVPQMQGQYLEVRCLRTIAGEHVAHLRIRAERVGYGGAGPAVEKAGAEYYVWLARTTTGFKVLGRRRSDDFEPINTAELESGLKTLRNVFRSHDVGAWTKALLTAPEFARVELLRHISWRRWEKSVAIPSLASMPEASRSQLAQAVLVALSQSTGPARATAHRAASALLEWATPDNRTRLKVIARTDLESKDVAIWSAALRTLSVAHPQEAIRHALRAMESANPKIRIGALKSIRVCLRDPVFGHRGSSQFLRKHSTTRPRGGMPVAHCV